MLRHLTYPFRQRRIVRTLTALLLLSVVFFSGWFVWTFFSVIQFRDNLISREYEGSLTTNLGFLVALTSEASQINASLEEQERQPGPSLEIKLTEAQARLSTLVFPSQKAEWRLEKKNLRDIFDTNELLALFQDPTLDQYSIADLGLRYATRPEFPSYGFVESVLSESAPSSYVFIPAIGVTRDGSLPDLSTKMRQELIFSKIAGLELQSILRDLPELDITATYFISCSDFIRLVALGIAPRPEFSPLRSFVDRTYFWEAYSANGHVRQTLPYLDVTGDGLVRTYSAFVDNTALQVCGMLAVDVRIRPLTSLWNKVQLGTRTGALRDFTFATYFPGTHNIQPAGELSPALSEALLARLVQKKTSLKKEIVKLAIEDTKIFTVPIGKNEEYQDQIGLFIFDSRAERRKYYGIFGLGFLLISCFVLMVAQSARVQAAAERMEDEILENLHGGFVIVNQHGKILGATTRFWQMVESDPAPKAIEDFLSTESSAEYRRLASGESFAGNLIGEEPIILASAPISLPGEPDARMLILIPSAELEQAIAKRFLNIFSHALKSPIQSILLIADLFRRRNALPRFEEYYLKLYRKVEEFRVLTNNMLRFSALDLKAVQVDVESVNVAQVLRQVLSAAHERARAKNLAFYANIPDSLNVGADAQLLQVVFNNLIDNALKYTAVGKILVNANDLLTRVRVVVEDTGPGVPEDERARIFELFVRGSQLPAEGSEGLGLGLYISRLYVEAMGGMLTYEPLHWERSQSETAIAMKGSRFIVELQKTTRGANGEQEDEDFAY